MHSESVKNLTLGKEVSENRRNISKNVPHKTFLLSIDIGRIQIKVLTTTGNILIAYFLVVYYLIQNIQLSRNTKSLPNACFRFSTFVT